MKAQPITRVKIEKLVFGGQALGRASDQTSDKVYFVWNALPGEIVDVEVTRKKKNFCEGYAVAVIEPSPLRVAGVEEHYLSCSPWQILSPANEQDWKIKLGQEAYYHLDNKELVAALPIIDAPADQYYGYRNKIEYSFTDKAGQLDLAFFQRGTHWKRPIQPCVLASDAINTISKIVLDWLRNQNITAYNLKSLIILNNECNETIVGLFIKDKINFTSWPDFPATVKGFQLYFSNPKSPAAVPTELLYSVGDDYLTSQVLDVALQHGLLGFFQVNVPVFTQAVQDMTQWLDPALPIIDYYSGVGSISIPLAKYCQSATLIESNAEAVQFAQRNITTNHLDNYSVQLTPAEKMLDCIQAEQIVIVDPPRAGLHEDVVKQLLAVKPKRIIYLSCNLSTQARDLALLQQAYQLQSLKLYNFFPRTPHIEGLAVLQR